MATRSNVIVKNAETKVQLYHHHDSYPEGVGRELQEEFFKSLSEDVAKKNDFLSSPSKAAEMLNEFSTAYEIEGEIWLHGDIEYLYVIDLEEETIVCYDIWAWSETKSNEDCINGNGSTEKQVYFASLWDEWEDIEVE